MSVARIHADEQRWKQATLVMVFLVFVMLSLFTTV